MRFLGRSAPEQPQEPPEPDTAWGHVEREHQALLRGDNRPVSFTIGEAYSGIQMYGGIDGHDTTEPGRMRQLAKLGLDQLMEQREAERDQEPQV